MFALDPDPSPPPSPDAQCTAEAGYLGIHGNLGPQQAPSFNQTWQGPMQEPVRWCKVAPPPAVSPQNQIKTGADSLFCIVCNFSFCPGPGVIKRPSEPLFCTQELLRGRGSSEVGTAAPTMGFRGAAPAQRLDTVSTPAAPVSHRAGVCRRGWGRGGSAGPQHHLCVPLLPLSFLAL